MIDTHCHLDISQLIKNHKEIIRTVNKIIIPAIECSKMNHIMELVENENVFFASGNHPTRTETFNEKLIEKYLSHKKCVAVGECGIDLYRKKDILKQTEQLEIQISLAKKYNKPMIIHSRDADNETFNILNKSEINGVIHSYIGSEKLLKLVDQGFYFGINGILTYPTATELREGIKKIPLDRLLLETDAPFLSPQAVRKDINQPKYMSYILEEMSIILKIDKEKLLNKINENTYRLFEGLKND